MIAVVGFEGDLTEGFHITWGTAALTVGDRLVNPTTGLSSPVARLDELADHGALYRFAKPIPLQESETKNPLILVAVEEKSEFFRVLTPESGRHGGVIKRVPREGAACYILRNPEALRQFSLDVSSNILKHALESTAQTKVDHDLVRAGLALDPGHPELNAMNVFYAKANKEHVRTLARACVRGAQRKERFDEFLNALNSRGKRHVLEYEEGVAEGGGLDVSWAAKILGGIERVVGRLGEAVRFDFPYLPEVASPRLRKLLPGSAKLEFAADIGKKTVGERVARYLELRALERALSGDAPSNLLDDPAFDSNLELIVRPSEETSLRQKPFEETESQPVSFQAPPVGELTEVHLTVPGVVTGALTDGHKLEVRIFNGARGRLLLSTTDDGSQQEPVGLEFMQEPTIPRNQLAILDLLRVHNARRREHYYLRGIVLLKADTPMATVSCVPSSVVRGAFRLTAELPVSRDGSRLVIGGKRTDPLLPGDKGLETWLKSYRVVCTELELSDERRQWIEAVRASRASSLERVLVSLAALDGEAVANELAEEVSRRFTTIFRINNTRREVIQNPGLLVYPDEARKMVALTEAGKAYAAAYRKAGGDVGLEIGED